MIHTLSNRKNIRLHPSVYESTGLYFITICIQNRACMLGLIKNDELIPSTIGEAVTSIIIEYSHHYPGLDIQQYVVMPNHVHLLIFRSPDEGLHTISLSRFISRIKSTATLKCGKAIWQRGFYDHVIRSEDERLCIMEYIQNNPRKWELDKEFVNQ